jgi:hypothetical protein
MQERKEGGRHSSEEVGRSAHMVDTSYPRVVHLGISPNRWRAAKWLAWGVFLGLFQADLELGPKTKIEAHAKLYAFH